MFLRIPKCRDFNIHVLMVSPKHLWVEAAIISSFSLGVSGVIPKTLRVCSFCPFLYFDSFHLFYHQCGRYIYKSVYIQKNIVLNFDLDECVQEKGRRHEWCKEEIHNSVSICILKLLQIFDIVGLSITQQTVWVPFLIFRQNKEQKS